MTGLCLPAPDMPAPDMSGVDLPGPAPGLSPQGLAGAHPLWASEVKRFGPWERQGDWWSARGVRRRGLTMVCGPCPSSLDAAWALLDQGILAPFDAVLAVSQTTGRGQLRRRWSSPAGNLHAAWVLPRFPAAWDSLTPLVAGWWVAEVLSGLGLEVAVKWPNDILVGGRKAGGVLVEERNGRLVLGLGLNLAAAPDRESMRGQAAVPAGILGQGNGKAPSPNNSGFPGPAGLWFQLEDYGESWYQDQLPRYNPEDFISIFESRLAFKGERVMVHGAGEPRAARILGLASDGGLVLGSSGRTEVLHSGSLTPAGRFDDRE